MEFRLLGPLEVSERERLVALGGLKQRSLLAILLLHANELVSTDRLHAELWGDAAPVTAAKSIQVYVSRLRKELGADRLTTRAPGYVLHVDASELDLARFERLREEARRAEPTAAARKLREALALWRGGALADLAYEPFAQTEIARLEELRLVALEERIDADLATGRDAELIGELEALVAEHPLRERLRGQLMLALYRSARQAEALHAYQVARRELSDELGLEPSGELKRTRAGDPPAGPGARAQRAAAALQSRRARTAGRSSPSPRRSTAWRRCSVWRRRWRPHRPSASSSSLPSWRRPTSARRRPRWRSAPTSCASAASPRGSRRSRRQRRAPTSRGWRRSRASTWCSRVSAGHRWRANLG